jgi:GT2 family glycosyltransferase
VVSIVIVTWNSEKDIIPCLKSIIKQKQYGFSDFEIIVVDNNSKDKTVSIIEHKFPDVILVKNSGNFGYARANNQGIKVSRGEYILLLNPDVMLGDNFFSSPLKLFKESSSVGAIGPQLLNPELTIQASIRSFPDYSILLWEITSLSKLLPNNRLFGRWRIACFDYNKPQQVEQPMTSCLLARKSVFDKIGYFDESFPMYYNDVDLCKRIIGAGFKIFYLPDSNAIHNRGSSTRKVRSKMIFSMHKSMYHYFEKYDKSGFFQVKRLLLYPIMVFSAIIRASLELLVK